GAAPLDEVLLEAEQDGLVLGADALHLARGLDPEQAGEEGRDLAGDADQQRRLLGLLERARLRAMRREGLGPSGVGRTQLVQKALVKAPQSPRTVQVGVAKPGHAQLEVAIRVVLGGNSSSFQQGWSIPVSVGS